jgi:hypothetical protein
MDIGSILAVAALLALVVAFIGRPLLEGGGTLAADEDRELSALLAERDRILSRLQELDMDRAMNKLLEADYQVQRSELLNEGAGVLRRIDALQPAEVVPTPTSELDQEIEREVARLRAASADPASFCPACGGPVGPGDRYCMRCGEPLTEGAGA